MSCSPSSSGLEPIGRKRPLPSFVLREPSISAANLFEDFDPRLRIQKAIYPLKVACYPFEYNFKLYIRGSYSTGLADDYMELTRHGDQEIESLANEMSDDNLRSILGILKGVDNESLGG